MAKYLANNILVDLGSTTIKYFRFDDSGLLSDSGFFARDYDEIVGKQASEILENELAYNQNSDIVKICSSANGGLKVGIIGYTERISAKWAAKAAFNSGANVCWALGSENLEGASMCSVDVLIVAGGASNSTTLNQSRWLKIIKQMNVNFEAIVFSGNELLHSEVQKLWPKIILTRNVLGKDLKWEGDELVETLRQAYLFDLVGRKGISNMKPFSAVPIIPTPAVVQKAFKAILDSQTKFHFGTPLLMLDIGGATTDLFFGAELLPDDGYLSPKPPVNRHVFSDLGIFTSKDALLSRLSLSHRLSDFLFALDPSSAEKNYLSLRENNNDFITPDFLAEACFFLALEACCDKANVSPSLELNRVACILVTGGASQLCDPIRLKRIANICGALNTDLVLDDKYEVWLEGMNSKE